MRWILNNTFILSANFHDGAVLVNYPWDNYQDESVAQSGVHETPGKIIWKTVQNIHIIQFT